MAQDITELCNSGSQVLHHQFDFGKFKTERMDITLPVQVLSLGEQLTPRRKWVGLVGRKIHTALTTRATPENCWLEFERDFDECAAFEYRRGVSPGASLKCHEGNIWMHRMFVHVPSSAPLTRLDETYIFILFFLYGCTGRKTRWNSCGT